jgi:hypothetical protein
MTIVIKIEEPSSIEDMKAVGAKDLLEFFLPKAGIYATKVRVSERLPEETQRMIRGERYTFYEDVATLESQREAAGTADETPDGQAENVKGDGSPSQDSNEAKK